MPQSSPQLDLLGFGVASAFKMERPSKRPRLHLFDHLPSSDMELESARRNNDSLLKTRFESIFEKYSHDFTNVGDEIDTLTGDLIVNNGHLERMMDETDTGMTAVSIFSNHLYNGKTLLRAMTTATEDEDEIINPGADEVLQSIETIADNAMSIDDSYSSGSEDDLFATSPAQPSGQDGEPRDVMDDSYSGEDQEVLYDSDADSLFEKQNTFRSSSPDSLFGDQDEPNMPTDESNLLSQIQIQPDKHSVPPDRIPTEAEILEKYRPVIREELMGLLEERREMAESLIEPAWRVPIHVTPMFQSAPVSSVSGQDSSSLGRNTSTEATPLSPNATSLWRQPAKPNTLKPQPKGQNSSLHFVRNESEDPLQEGFSSDSEERLQEHKVLSSESEYEEPLPETIAENLDELYAVKAERKRLIEASSGGVCPYCKIFFTNKSGVMAHWDRWITKPARHRPTTDPHDVEMMSLMRENVVRRVRNPRLIVSDFRTMVELHEGAGLSFEEICRSKTLRTRKTASQLRDIYDKHRSIPLPNHSPAPLCRWTRDEEQTLLETCENERATMATLSRRLTGKDVTDVGNKLAEIWLRHFKPQNFSKPREVIYVPRSRPVVGTDESDEYSIKVESDDDLFA